MLNTWVKNKTNQTEQRLAYLVNIKKLLVKWRGVSLTKNRYTSKSNPWSSMSARDTKRLEFLKRQHQMVDVDTKI